MKRIAIVLSAVLFISHTACAGIWAQATAQISGSAKDQSGALLPGVVITVTQTSDRRHILNLTSVAETPQFANPTMRTLATGWRLSGIFRQSASIALNILAGSDAALTGMTNQRANQISGDPFGDRSTGPMAQYLDPAAFAQPAKGTTGNIGRNSESRNTKEPEVSMMPPVLSVERNRR